MRKIILLVAALLVPAASVNAESLQEAQEKVTAKIREVYSIQGMREVTETCREKSRQTGGDMQAMMAFAEETYADQNQQLACLSGYLLYKNGKTGSWSEANAVANFSGLLTSEEYRKYKERAQCAALQSDLRNYKTNLEVYFADRGSYPKTAEFKLDADGTTTSFSYKSAGTVIDYKPTKDLQKYRVTARSDSCSAKYAADSESSSIKKQVKMAAKKARKKD